VTRLDFLDCPELLELGLMAAADPGFAERMVEQLMRPEDAPPVPSCDTAPPAALVQSR